MTQKPLPDDATILHLVSWAEARPDVRALIWNSSPAKRFADPQAELQDVIDDFSDYDVILVVEDIRPYYESRGWLSAFGTVLVLYRDPLQEIYGGSGCAYITQFEDGLKIDFGIWTPQVVRGIVASGSLPEVLDVGYAVLLDKDGLTEGLRPPTHRAFIPPKPSQEEYLTAVELLFHEATYAAKYLWRDELMPAKFMLDSMIKYQNLRQMLEWRIEVEHGWSLKPGGHGRYLKRRLPPPIWSELEATYVGPGIEESWQSLFRMIELFRKVASEVGDSLGYDYPEALHRRALAYLQRVRELDREKRKLL